MRRIEQVPIDERYGYIYLTECKVNYKIYIGQHKGNQFDKYYIGSGVRLLEDVEKYGFKAFNCCGLEWCRSKDELDRCEVDWITYSRNFMKRCPWIEMYNLADGGVGGDVIKSLPLERQEEIYKKLRESRKGKTPFLGHNHSEESRRKMSESRTGPGHWNYGKHHSEETCARIRDAQIGRVHMTKDSINLLVLPEEVQKYLDDGWIYGMYSRTRGRVINQRITISKGGKYLLVPKSEYNDVYSHQGWIITNYPNIF